MAQSQILPEGQPGMLTLQMPSMHGAVALLRTPSGPTCKGLASHWPGPGRRLGSWPGSTLCTCSPGLHELLPRNAACPCTDPGQGLVHLSILLL